MAFARRPPRATRSRPARSGCSTLAALLLLAFGLFMAFGWPLYVDRSGTAAAGQITEKRENIHVWYSDWSRRFEVLASYPIPGQRVRRTTSCYVDQKTFDSLRTGGDIAVHYLPRMPFQPFFAVDHLEPCSPF